MVRVEVSRRGFEAEGGIGGVGLIYVGNIGSLVVYGLFASQCFYRIGEGGADGLVADGDEGDGEGKCGGEGEDPPVEWGAVLISLQPSIEEPAGQGEGDEAGEGDELHEFFQE